MIIFQVNYKELTTNTTVINARIQAKNYSGVVEILKTNGGNILVTKCNRINK